jgi:hypothetical protein
MRYQIWLSAPDHERNGSTLGQSFHDAAKRGPFYIVRAQTGRYRGAVASFTSSIGFAR